MLSGASREVARLPLCRCGYKSVLLSGVFWFAEWTLTRVGFVGVCSTVFFLHALNSYGHRALRC